MGTVDDPGPDVGAERLRVRYRISRRLKLGWGSCNSTISAGLAISKTSSTSNARLSMSMPFSSPRTATRSLIWSAVYVEKGSGRIRLLTVSLMTRFRGKCPFHQLNDASNEVEDAYTNKNASDGDDIDVTIPI